MRVCSVHMDASYARRAYSRAAPTEGEPDPPWQ